jgi:hypothetical protein
MSGQEPRPKRKLRWCLIAALYFLFVVLAGAAAIVVSVRRCRSHQEQMIAAIKSEGGDAGLTVTHVSSGFPFFDFLENKRNDLFPKLTYATLVSDESTKHLPDLPYLSRLTLRGSQISDTAMLSLKNAPRGIEDLTLENTSITDRGIREIGRLPTMYGLRIKAHAISDAMVSELVKAGGALKKVCSYALQHVTIETSCISDESLLLLKNLGVGTLQIEDSEVGDRSLANIEGYPLFSLRLVRCRITDEGLTHLTRLKYLTALDISGNKITDKGLTALDGVDLRYFMFDHTMISAAGWAEYQKRHPTTQNQWPPE